MATLSFSQSQPRRLLSLDILRGLTVAFMILVNSSGPGAWPQLHHAAWNGLTATDLVFPTFLFVVGISIVFATEARLRRGDARTGLLRHALRRAVLLVLLGIVVNTFPFVHLPYVRFYGVLQRIAVCYLAVALLYLWDRRIWTKGLLLVCLLAGYWMLLRWVPVPGAGLPGRNVPFLDQNQNIVAWLDRQLLPGHLYEDAPLHDARDPEGLLSDLPAIGTTLAGLLAGLWLLGSRSTQKKTMGLFAAAAASLAAGYLWSLWFPLNKKLWTSSYVLVAAGWSLAVLALVYWAIEQRGWGRKGLGKALAWPCLVFGSNAIVAYTLSELLDEAQGLIRFTDCGKQSTPLLFVFQHVFLPIPDPGWRTFLYALFYVCLCFLPVWLLYRKKIFVKL